MNKILITICLSIIYNFSFAQTRAIHIKDTLNNLLGQCLKTTQSGNLIVSGMTYNETDKKIRPFCAKINDNGDLIWTKTDADAAFETLTGFIANTIELANGNIVTVVNSEYKVNKPYLWCMDKDGNPVWKIRLNSFDNWNNAYPALSDGNNFFVSGEATDNQLAVIKFDSNGNILWSKKIDYPNNTYPENAQIVSMGNEIVVGIKSYNFAKIFDIQLLKLNKNNGTLLLNKKIEGLKDTLVLENIGFINDEIYLLGKSSDENNLSQPIILRLDKNFNVLKSEKFVSKENKNFTLINLQQNNGKLIGIATKLSPKLTFNDAAQGLISYNPTNSTLEYYGGMPNFSSYDAKFKLDFDKNNNIWQVGNTLSSGTRAIGLIKTKNIEQTSICNLDKGTFTKTDIQVKVTTPVFQFNNYTIQTTKETAKIASLNPFPIDNCLYCYTEQQVLKIEICEGSNFNYNNKVYSKAGIYKDTLLLNDCRAFFQIDIKTKSTLSGKVEKIICSTQPSILIAQKTYNKAGIFTDTLKTKTGCDSVLTINIKSLADLTVSLGADKEVLEGEKLDLSATTNYPNIVKKFTWLPDNTTSCDTCKTISVAPDKTQWYAVKAQIEGCFATDSINIKVLNQKLVFMPTAFRPNGDQINDVFRPYSNDAVEEIEYFIIYDRWGNHIFENTNFKPNDDNAGWNGTYKNIPANEGVYTYATQVRLKNGKTQKYLGDVMLTR